MTLNQADREQARQDLITFVKQESNIEVLRDLVLIADTVIASHIQTIEALQDDADRYALLKEMLPYIAETAATAGKNGGDVAIGVLATLDPDKLDAALDKELETDLLEQMQAQRGFMKLVATLNAKAKEADKAPQSDFDSPEYQRVLESL